MTRPEICRAILSGDARPRQRAQIRQIAFQLPNSAGSIRHWHPAFAWYSTAFTAVRGSTAGAGPGGAAP